MKNQRLYSLFRKHIINHGGQMQVRYVRESGFAYPKPKAKIAFSDALSCDAGYLLRPVKPAGMGDHLRLDTRRKRSTRS